MRKLTCCLGAAFAIAGSTALSAQDTVPQRIGPPVQKITTASAVSTERLGMIVGVRELPDGRVLVNDGMRRRLLLMDTTMSVVRVVLDSLSEIAHSYGTRPGALLPFRGDTTLFVDPASYAIVVLDPQANLTRVRSVWRVQDAMFFSSPTSPWGVPGLDARGRIVYRINAQPAPPAVAPPPGVPWFPSEPDSAFIVAVNIDTRAQDTLAVIRIPRTVTTVRRSGEGFWYMDQAVNPLPVTDDWAVLPDGTVAIVRAIDYRVEYLGADGKWTSSQKLPFEWSRLTDEDKTRIADSTKAALQKQNAGQFANSMIRWVNMYGRDYPVNFTVPEGFVPSPGMPKDWILPKGVTLPEGYIYACPPGVESTASVQTMMMQGPPGMMVTTRETVSGGPPGMVVTTREGAPAGAAPANAARAANPAAAGQPPCLPAPVTFSSGQVPPVPQPRPVSVVPAAELPDYKPPIPTNAVRADMDGNLWIRTLPPKPIPGGPVFDVVNRQGELVNRLQLPPGYTLAGFGRGKVLYLTMRDASGLHLARVRLK